MATLIRGRSTIVVPDDAAAFYLANGWVDPSAPTAVVLPEGEPSESWTNKQLEALAERDGIDLSPASNKTQRLELIASHTG